MEIYGRHASGEASRVVLTVNDNDKVVSLLDHQRSKAVFHWESKPIIEISCLNGAVKYDMDPWDAAVAFFVILREILYRQHGQPWGEFTLFSIKSNKPFVQVGTNGTVIVDEAYIPDAKTKMFWNALRIAMKDDREFTPEFDDEPPGPNAS